MLIVAVPLVLSIILHGVQSEDVLKSKYLPCNPTAEPTTCPKGSNCIDNGTADSFCVCSSNFTVNSNFSTDSYCVEKVEPHPPVTATTTVKTIPSTTEKIVKATTTESAKIESTLSPVAQTTTIAKSEQNDVKVAPAVPHHHILSGIFLPIFIVLGFIAGVFVVKKYELLDRAHSLIRNRSQNQYNGLMETDFDDDACLI